MKKTLSNIINSKFCTIIIQLLIIFSILSFSIETLPNIDKTLKIYLSYTETIIVIFFTIEYIIRIYISKKINYIFSFYGIIDLFAILPFYITLGTLDVRALRIFGLFRIFRIVKLIQFTSAIEKFQAAFDKIKRELLIFSVFAIFLLYLSSVGIYYFENSAQPEIFKSVFHSFWWSVTTLTTAGYGDMVPITFGGKVFASFILLIGIGIVSVPDGLLASALTNGKK